VSDWAICTKPRFAGSWKRSTIWQDNCEVHITATAERSKTGLCQCRHQIACIESP
jgi:hypothetical protein